MSSPCAGVVDDSRLSFHLDLPLAGRAPALARRAIVEVLRSWFVTDEDWTYDVTLLSSELVGNAVRHGGQRVALGLTLGDTDLVVEVRDGSSVMPVPRDGSDESGRGLAIIAAIAADWGVREHADGKTVWARITGPATTYWRAVGAGEARGSAPALTA